MPSTSLGKLYDFLSRQVKFVLALLSKGDIGRLQAEKGDINQALSLHRARLRDYQKLRDMDGQASALLDIGMLKLQRGELATP